MSLFSPPRTRRRAKQVATRIPEVAALDLVEETDVRGFDTGYLVDQPRKQVTVSMGLDAGTDLRVVPENQWRTWEDAIAASERMVATATIDEAGDAAGPPRIATTFRAVGKSQRKDITELVTDVSLRAAHLYDEADSMDLPVRPLNASSVAACAHISFTGHPPAATRRYGDAFNALGEVSVVEHVEDLIVGEDRRMVCFTVDIASDATAELLDEVMAQWEGEALLRRTRFFRPYVLPEGTGEDLATGAGRRWAVITCVGDQMADVVLRQAFDETPAVSLSMRRLRGRQRISALTGCGIGVLGFQHITSALTTAPDMGVV